MQMRSEPDNQNSVISFVLSKWLLPELSIPAAGQKDRRLWGREWSSCVMYILLRTFRRVIYVFRAHVDYITFCYGMCALCVLRYVSYAL